MGAPTRHQIVPVLLSLALGGCGSSAAPSGGYSAASDMGSARGCFGANDCAPGQQCNQFGQCVALPVGGASDAGLAPEVHVKIEPPASGKRYVYVALPTRDSVVKIDSVTLEARAISVGGDPGPLRTVTGQDVALTLNKASSTATLLRSQPDGSDVQITLPTAAGLNSLDMSPDGRHALGWFDLALSGGVLAPQQSFQEVTLFTLDAGAELAVNLSVGFRPGDVQWAPDGSAAYIITDQGISIVPLKVQPKPGIVTTVPLVRDPFSESPPTGVQVTADGLRALALQEKVSGVRVVDLGTGAIVDIGLGGTPSDLEITPKADLAIAVLRDQNSVAFIRLPGDLMDPKGIVTASTGVYLAGQAAITADSARALLFSNASNQKAVLVADLATRTIKPLPLEKGVRGVLPAPDGQSAIIVHNKAPGTPLNTDPLPVYLDKLQAYSLFNLASGYARLQPTPAQPGPIAFTPDGASAFVLLRDDAAAVRSVDLLDLKTFLVENVKLGSPPQAVGSVPMGKQVFVAQDHPLGRITFIDSTSFKTRTLTGFALNGGIIE